MDGKKRKRKSRWGGEGAEKIFIPGMPTAIPQNMSDQQEEQYLLQLQIEEISRRLRTGDLGIPPNPEDRSPSPEPIYNNEGKRLNTREYRTRKKLEDERHQCVQKALKLNTEYKPPPDYKPPVIRVNDKVMIPQEEHPDINFVGLLIGPRGNTLKNLEKETGAKIIIRGKGSVKEGKIGRKDGQPLPGEDEPLHAYVTANNPENVAKAVEKIKEIIRQGIEVPEGQNDLRRQQLRELALLNGTLRENDGLAKLKQLQQAQTIITNTIICTVCGGSGHIAQDCKQKRPGDTFRAMQHEPPQTSADRAKMDSEYMSLMAELGEGPPPKNDPVQPTRHFGQPPPHMASMQNMRQQNPPWQQPGPAKGPVMGQSMQPPASMQGSQPQMVGPPPIASSGACPLPPWQQSIASSGAPAPTSSSSSGLAPPGMMAPPPPPPPSSQQLPWQQQPQQAMQNFGVPPPGGQSLPPWQQPQQQPVAPVPPPPAPGTMPPWQQAAPPQLQQQQQQPQQQQPMMGSPMVPPPPPPGAQNFNPMAPPPPPPGSTGLPQGIPLGVPPPPPPN